MNRFKEVIAMFSFFSMIWSWLKEWVRSIFSKDEPSEPDPSNPADDPGLDRPERPDRPGDIVCYYGCPNSKKAAKLQLQRKLYR